MVCQLGWFSDIKLQQNRTKQQFERFS